MAIGVDIALLIVLLFLSGFFSASEIALVSLSSYRVRHMVTEKRVCATHIKRLKDNPHRMLTTILIGNNVVNIGASALTTVVMLNMFESYAVGITTGVMTFLILVFGELTPKSIATRNNEKVAQVVAPVLWFMSIILSPLLFFFEKLTNVIMFLLGVKEADSSITEEEIKTIVEEAEEEGTIKEMEKEMIHNIFEFDDINTSEIATPRTDMVVIEAKKTVVDAVKLISRKKLSRIPVYAGHKDNIVGIVYVKDLLKYMSTAANKKKKISSVMKKPFFVPETKNVSNLLRLFQKRKEQMAIVVDEHGHVTGLITLEDVLEEIVGEIMDETDKVDPHIEKAGKDAWFVSGRADIDEVNETLNMHLKGDEYDTFGGFVLDYTEKIPDEGEEFKYKNFFLKIEEREGNRILKVKVKKIADFPK